MKEWREERREPEKGRRDKHTMMEKKEDEG